MKRVTINVLTDVGCLITFIPLIITCPVLYSFLLSYGGTGGQGQRSPFQPPFTPFSGKSDTVS
jgi:hypothetical protein